MTRARLAVIDIPARLRGIDETAAQWGARKASPAPQPGTIGYQQNGSAAATGQPPSWTRQLCPVPAAPPAPPAAPTPWYATPDAPWYAVASGAAAIFVMVHILTGSKGRR